MALQSPLAELAAVIRELQGLQHGTHSGASAAPEDSKQSVGAGRASTSLDIPGLEGRTIRGTVQVPHGFNDDVGDEAAPDHELGHLVARRTLVRQEHRKARPAFAAWLRLRVPRREGFGRSGPNACVVREREQVQDVTRMAAACVDG